MLQIIGTKKHAETRKAVRACQERNIPFQFIDLNERTLSEGEWESVLRSIPAETLIDTASSFYVKEGYAWREYDAADELREHSQLMKQPVLRNNGKATVGFDLAFIIGASS